MRERAYILEPIQYLFKSLNFAVLWPLVAETMASLLRNFWATPRFALNQDYKPQCIAQIRCLASRDSTLLSSDTVRVNGVPSIEEREKVIPIDDVENGHLSSSIKEKSKEDIQDKLEPLWDDGYGTQTVKDFLEIGSDIIKPDGGPPRWFTPISAGPPLKDSPLLLFLPGNLHNEKKNND